MSRLSRQFEISSYRNSYTNNNNHDNYSNNSRTSIQNIAHEQKPLIRTDHPLLNTSSTIRGRSPKINPLNHTEAIEDKTKQINLNSLLGCRLSAISKNDNLSNTIRSHSTASFNGNMDINRLTKSFILDNSHKESQNDREILVKSGLNSRASFTPHNRSFHEINKPSKIQDIMVCQNSKIRGRSPKEYKEMRNSENFQPHHMHSPSITGYTRAADSSILERSINIGKTSSIVQTPSKMNSNDKKTVFNLRDPKSPQMMSSTLTKSNIHKESPKNPIFERKVTTPSKGLNTSNPFISSSFLKLLEGNKNMNNDYMKIQDSSNKGIIKNNETILTPSKELKIFQKANNEGESHEIEYVKKRRNGFYSKTNKDKGNQGMNNFVTFNKKEEREFNWELNNPFMENNQSMNSSKYMDYKNYEASTKSRNNDIYKADNQKKLLERQIIEQIMKETPELLEYGRGRIDSQDSNDPQEKLKNSSIRRNLLYDFNRNYKRKEAFPELVSDEDDKSISLKKATLYLKSIQ